MPVLLYVAIGASVFVTGGILALTEPAERLRGLLRAVLAVIAAAIMTSALGAQFGAETPAFLLALSCGVAPVSLLLAAGMRDTLPRVRWAQDALAAAWAVIVFPLAAVMPSILLAVCDAPECRVQDFGGALPLLVSSGAAMLWAWRSRPVLPDEGWRHFAAPVGVVWLAGIVWLTSLEGVLDEYVPRILFAAVVAPVGGGLAWVLVDALRSSRRHPLRSFADGIVVGLVAIVPGAATISFPWSMLVGVMAGAVGALVYGAQRIAVVGRVAHWGLIALTSAAVGYLAPAVSADTMGLLFSGRITGIVPPLGMFLAVAALGALCTAPVWAAARWSSAAQRQHSRSN